MKKVSFLKNNKLGDAFVQNDFLPKGETEYYIRNKQVNATEKHWRNLTNDEITILKANANYADDWNSVLVSDVFDPECIYNSRFYGLIRIGDICCGVLQYDNLQLPIGIYNPFCRSRRCNRTIQFGNVL